MVDVVRPTSGGPSHDLVPATPSGADVTFDVNKTIGFYVETAGDVAFETRAGNVRTIACADFSYHPHSVARIVDAGTDAAGIHVAVIG